MTTATPTSYEHIALDERGAPWIPEANTKVAEIVAKVKLTAGARKSSPTSFRT